jgi:hypothetical protein
MSNRLNDERSAIIVIMQRLHEGDVSGDILAREANYCHLMIPMYFAATTEAPQWPGGRRGRIP